MNRRTPESWYIGAASAEGARHTRRNEPSEDSFKAGTVAKTHVAAVADGHGSPRCTRASVGARFAAEIGFTVMTATPRVAIPDLAGEVVSRWRRAVEADLASDPPTTDECEIAPAPHHLLYGTTLMCVSIEGPRLRLLQIGDGDILLGATDAPHANRPIPPLEVDSPGQTDSLSQPDAEDRTVVAEYDLTEMSVDVVMLASDGLDTAYEDSTWHDETMADLLRRVSRLSEDDLHSAVQEWCQPPAEVGGDDTTIAVLVRAELLGTDLDRS